MAHWIRIRIWICIEIKSWIWIRIETNANPQHWFINFRFLLLISKLHCRVDAVLRIRVVYPEPGS